MENDDKQCVLVFDEMSLKAGIGFNRTEDMEVKDVHHNDDIWSVLFSCAATFILKKMSL